MKLVFTFAESANLKKVSKYNIYKSNLEVPDEALHLIGLQERVLGIAELAGFFTRAFLFLTCKELGFKNILVNSQIEDPVPHLFSVRTIYLPFQRAWGKPKKRPFKILFPITSPYSHHPSLISFVSSPSKTDKEWGYAEKIKHLADQLLVLLNAQPAPTSAYQWGCYGFYGNKSDNALVDLFNRRQKKQVAERRKRERETARKKAQEAKGEKSAHPKTGAGRRAGAVPGVFMGIQFRSQLEIRLATQLEQKGIEWIYESERLGDGNYLVDFHLPTCKCWVEVKGQFEPRDHFLLQDVEEYLRRERNERLFVYTSRNVIEVTAQNFNAMKHSEFWSLIDH